MSTNPFVYSRPVDPRDVVDREGETKHLIELAEGGHNTLLFAPRRFGKTSLLGKVLADGERTAGLVPLIVDLSDALTVGDVAVRLERSYKSLRGPVRRVVTDALSALGLGVSFGIASIQAQLEREPRTDPLPVIHGLLDLPIKVHAKTGRRTLVVLDEFQHVLDLQGVDGVLRSHIQHHGDAAAYVFSGSEPSMLRQLFEDRARPLYGQAEPLRLGRLPEDEAVRYVVKRFRATGRYAEDAVMDLVALGQGHPQRLMLLSHRLWAETLPGRAADSQTLDHAVTATLRQTDQEFEALWISLRANERRVLAAVADGRSPYEQDTLAATGLKQRSSAQIAVRSLAGKAILEDEPRLRIVDPILQLWLQRRREGWREIFVFPDSGGWAVADGPSREYVRTRHRSRDAAESAADALARGSPSVIHIYDTDDPADLPAWARPTG